MYKRNALLTFLTLLSFASFGANHISVVTEDWPPYNYLDENGEMTGYSTKVVKKVLEKANVQYDIRLYPWARSYEMAQIIHHRTLNIL